MLPAQLAAPFARLLPGPRTIEFSTNEGDSREPVRIRARLGSRVAKIWFDLDVRIASSSGFSAKEQALRLDAAEFDPVIGIHHGEFTGLESCRGILPKDRE